MADLTKKYDVLVAGGGNAALCAAIAARRAGSSVLVLEMASKFYRGGNTRHTRNIRCAHDAATETLSGPYPEEEFFKDLLQVTQGQTDEPLARHMIAESKLVLDWLPQQGVRFQPSLGGTLEPRPHQFVLPRRRALDAQRALSHRRKPRRRDRIRRRGGRSRHRQRHVPLRDRAAGRRSATRCAPRRSWRPAAGSSPTSSG